MKTKVEPAIWVADLAAHNSGILHGKWIPLCGKDRDEVYEIIEEILAEGTKLYGKETCSEKHEEFAIHDYEGFGPIKVGEYDSISDLLEHVERIHDDPDKYFAYIDAKGEHYADSYDPDNVYGPYASEEDYAYQTLDDCLGNESITSFLESKGVPFASFFKFDAEDFIRSEKSASTSFGKYDGKTYVIVE